MTDEVEWIKARKAHLLLIQAGLHPAEFHIRQALRLGKVQSRALHAEIKPRGRHGGPTTEFEDWDVPQEVWKGSVDTSAFSLDGDYFSNGDYAVRLGTVELTGLSFNKADIVEYFEIDEAPPAITTITEPLDDGKNRGGRAPKSDEWNRTLAALIVYAQSGAGVAPGAQPGEIYTAALDYASSLGMEGDGISIDRCKSGIYQAQALIKKVEDEAAAKADGRI